VQENPVNDVCHVCSLWAIHVPKTLCHVTPTPSFAARVHYFWYMSVRRFCSPRNFRTINCSISLLREKGVFRGYKNIYYCSWKEEDLDP
jgi:hypothetical protein